MAPKGKITKVDLSRRLSEALGYTKKDADFLVSAFFQSMTAALQSGEGIELRGFGSFRVRHRAPRMGRNPKSGQPVLVPHKLVVHFKIGKDLRIGLVAPAPPDPQSEAE
jgi:integration host factor subunit beta